MPDESADLVMQLKSLCTAGVNENRKVAKKAATAKLRLKAEVIKGAGFSQVRETLETSVPAPK